MQLRKTQVQSLYTPLIQKITEGRKDKMCKKDNRNLSEKAIDKITRGKKQKYPNMGNSLQLTSSNTNLYATYLDNKK